MPRLRFLATLVVFMAGCSGAPAGVDLGAAPDDGTSPLDLATAPPDLAPMADLGSPPDLVPPPKLIALPTCAVMTVNATTLYNQVAMMRCTGRYCHGTLDPIGNFNFDSAAQMRQVWVGRLSAQGAMPFITSNNVDRSYVLWKLLNEQSRLAPPERTGMRMPLPPRDALTQTELCLFVNWIRSGAN